MDHSECLVSVLCTAYNHEKYLRGALDSFVSQKTDFTFEVLVNDDASTDGTADILREYAQRYPDIIRPFYQKKNLFSQGIAAIYKQVLYPNARGRYLAVCEGDDYWTDDTKLQRQADFMEAHPEYSACVHNTTLRYCSGGQEDRPLLSRSGDGDVLLKNVLRGVSYSFHTSSVFAKRELLTQPPSFLDVADSFGFIDHANALWLITNGPIRYLDRCMSVYRINSVPSAWSSGVDSQYAKLRRYTRGEGELLRAYRAFAAVEALPLVDAEILEKDFELMHIEGRDREQRQAPYAAILRRQPFRYRLTNLLKCALPHLNDLYRKNHGYI